MAEQLSAHLTKDEVEFKSTFNANSSKISSNNGAITFNKSIALQDDKLFAFKNVGSHNYKISLKDSRYKQLAAAEAYQIDWGALPRPQQFLIGISDSAIFQSIRTGVVVRGRSDGGSYPSTDLSFFGEKVLKTLATSLGENKCKGVTIPSALTGYLNNFTDTSEVTNMESMFANCKDMYLLELDNFSTASCTNMKNMFSNCKSLRSIDVDMFDTSKVTDMSHMFSNCSNLADIDVSRFDTSNTVSMRGMFSHCSSITALSLDNFVTDHTTSIHDMFLSCSKLNLDSEKPEISNWNVSNIKDMGGLFYGCSSLTGFPSNTSRKWVWSETGTVDNMYGMFSDCSSLVTLDVSDFKTQKLVNAGAMFKGCSKLKSIDLSKWDASSLESVHDMFSECSSLAKIKFPSKLPSNLQNMSWMFNKCESLSLADYVWKINTSNVTNMAGLFNGCSSIKSLDLHSFDTSNVTNMKQMFEWCVSLEELDMSGWDTSAVVNMDGMFGQCNSLKTLILGDNWASNAAVMSLDFSNCKLSHESACNIFEKLATRTNKPSITLNGTFSADELKVAQNKGWIVYDN